MDKRIVLGTVEHLQRIGTIKFQYEQEGIQREGFLLYSSGQVLAYENVCRHIPITLDYGEGQFLSKDGRHIICQTHGAIYEPLTGICVRGPCAGASLKKVKIEINEGEIILKDRST